MSIDREVEKAERAYKREAERLLPSPFVEANAYVIKPGAPLGTLVSVSANRFFREQEDRLFERKISAIPFASIDFKLVTPEELKAMRAATVIGWRHTADAIGKLNYYRPDHELTTVEVVSDYFQLRQNLVLHTYLRDSKLIGEIEQKKFDAQLDNVKNKVREDEHEIQIPLVQFLATSAIHSLNARVFYANFGLSMREPVLQEQLVEFAVFYENLTGFLLGRVQTELTKDPKRLGEVSTALLGFEPYGRDFDPEFETHNTDMLAVSPPGLVRADLVREAVVILGGEEFFLDLAKRRPFRDKLLAA